ncbi:bifunctional UDP-sugar hydrolase/5'-nucleotidase [Agrococcus sp. SL85]|uniref:bifunctional metallophosphatase/5'-nucleotidase n=1 Tax=Agrococcus sp. SL85 TaxID=2995141 RepID=UPI00226D2BF4|nr:bifunctional UDP-sugar hydrolase/5'-nucleotidase [Agrococcus sp. SL85]WAC66751.1 bifunctional UDP-sugar hydrolase/5'-nucleotidase [Agrococcus sp. SL85]
MNTHAKQRTLAATAACAVGAGLLVGPTAAVAAPIVVDPATTAVVNLLHFNDFHGRIDGETTPLFAATIEELRADYPASTLVLSGGDNIGASNFTSASQDDAPAIEVLNALDLDAAAVGNHEFDRGVDDLTGRVDALADFPYLAANVTLDGAPIAPAYETFEVDGVTVAVVGAVTQETPSLVDRGGIEGVAFSDPVAAVNEVVAELEAADAADVIVAEFHDGAGVGAALNAPQAEQEAALAPQAASDGFFGDLAQELTADVDVVFNAHTHQTYSWFAPVPGVDGELRPIVQSDQYSDVVGQVVLTVDRASGDVQVQQEDVVNHERLSVPEGGDAAAVIDGYAALYPRVAEVRDIVAEAEAEAEIVGSQQVGTIAGPFTVPAESNGNRGEESTMAQFVADMYRDQLASEERGGAEIGIVNPGGVRDSLLFAAGEGEAEDGIVTLAEANTVLPFINNLWTATLTGAQLDQVLEEQWQRDEAGTPLTSGRTYLQLGLSDNVTYVSDPTAPFDARVSDIRIDGVPVTDDQEIRVSSSSFLFGPGDNFWTLGAASDVRDSGLVDLDAMLAYLADNPGIAPDYAQRHVDVTGLPGDAVAEGESFELEVGQIDRIRSTGAEASTTLEVVDAEGAVVGAAEVVVNSDDSGAPLTTSATVEVTASFVGEGTEAAWQTLTLVADAGTEIPFQVLVQPAAVTEPPVETEEPTETPSATAPAPGDGQGGGGALPETGQQVSPMLWAGAGLLMLLGLGLVLLGRLRRQ